jgi:hypothetical protein
MVLCRANPLTSEIDPCIAFESSALHATADARRRLEDEHAQTRTTKIPRSD